MVDFAIFNVHGDALFIYLFINLNGVPSDTRAVLFVFLRVSSELHSREVRHFLCAGSRISFLSHEDLPIIHRSPPRFDHSSVRKREETKRKDLPSPNVKHKGFFQFF